MSRKAIWIGVIVGSTIGGFVPSLWHASVLSVSGVVFSTIGGLAGIWAARRWMT
jgi:predicted MFS family arabinose efflux permease